MILRLTEWILGRRPQTVAAVSPSELDAARKLVGRQSTVQLIPNVSTLDLPAASSERRGIVTCGRIGKQKDPEYFRQFVKDLSTSTQIVWIGDGDEEARERLLEAGVRVTGWLDARGVREAVLAAELYVHSAAWESSPYALLDAARAGTPVIARDIPSLSSLGYFTVMGGPSELAAAVDQFLEGGPIRDRVTSATADVDDRHTSAHLTSALDQLYKEVSP